MNDTKNDTIPTMTFASERDPSKLYSVAFSNNGTFNCSCLDFRYSGHKYCKHCKWASERLAAQQHAANGIARLGTLADLLKKISSEPIQIDSWKDCERLYEYIEAVETIANSLKATK